MHAVNLAEKIRFAPDKMVKTNVFNVPQLFLDLYGLEPGQAQRPHAHAENAKIYFVLEGAGTFTIGAEERVLEAGHAVLAPAGEDHGVRNHTSERLVLLVTMAPNPNFG